MGTNRGIESWVFRAGGDRRIDDAFELVDMARAAIVRTNRVKKKKDNGRATTQNGRKVRVSSKEKILKQDSNHDRLR